MIKLNLGCGPHAMPDWINYDLDAHPGVVQLDLSKGKLPHPDNSVDFVFSEHFIEHLTKEQFIALLKDVKRVLKPGGVFRISTPDLFAIAADYLNHKIDRWAEVWKPETGADFLNGAMRLWGHQYLFDRKEMFLIAHKVGFNEYYSVHHKQSDYSQLCNLEIRPYIMDLIVELRKQ